MTSCRGEGSIVSSRSLKHDSWSILSGKRNGRRGLQPISTKVTRIAISSMSFQNPVPQLMVSLKEAGYVCVLQEWWNCQFHQWSISSTSLLHHHCDRHLQNHLLHPYLLQLARLHLLQDDHPKMRLHHKPNIELSNMELRDNMMEIKW